MSTILTKQIRNFTDIDFSFAKHPITNNVTIKKDVNAIKQSVINLLTLREGDKPFHPEISSPIHLFLFENFSLVTSIVLESEIKKYLNIYEPRVNVESVDLSQSSTNDLRVVLTCTITNTSEPFVVNVLIERLR